MPVTRFQWLAMPVFILLSLSAGWLGATVTTENVGTWYRQLAFPTWAPPSWVFAPVWTVLYLMMGAAAWLIWQRVGVKRSAVAMGLFLLQLLLNAVWPFIFFGSHAIGVAMAELFLLTIAVAATMVAFFRCRVMASLLLLPYLAWCVYAACLNYAIWRMN